MVKIDKYWVFDVESFIADYPDNRSILQDKKNALAELSETKAIQYDSPSGSSDPGDSTASVAERAIALKEEIDIYTHFVNTYEKAENGLTNEEKLIINTFFHDSGMQSSKVRFLSKKLNYEVAEIYRRRRLAIEHFKKLLAV